jgi:hypothetical protein
MKPYLLILALAVFWGVSGLVVSFGLNAMFGGDWAMFCTSLNVIAGMLMLLLTTRNPTARRIFYEGPRGQEPGLLILALLWGFPVVLIFAGILWWLLGQFFR